jgi:hypothetical protein
MSNGQRPRRSATGPQETWLDPNKLHLNYKALHVAIKDLVAQIDDVSPRLKTKKEENQEKSDKQFADELRQRLLNLQVDTECQISMVEEFDPAG